ncbi:hypothetical protein AAC387_Pa08g2468 [Persea americana]|eukprot:TRINITY_DN8849_c2_g1_i1.p1 TRINITY_DN8849_c2_g1~~TRINITY_DN8849_c2_g1_i1.p1  ORF type:complete len:394 (-),score=57.73 TRINITY_DN8849_c2_g1_i1:355-1536(-)
MSREREETSPIDSNEENGRVAGRRRLVGDLNVGSVEVVEPQDADYSYVPPLSDDLALMILARVPLWEQRKLCFVNNRYLGLLRSDELYKIRREIGAKETLVFFLSSGESHWWVVNPRTSRSRILPVLRSDLCFEAGDKESLCVGSHLLVSGREYQGLVIWRYELAMNRWIKGPSMINPRCLFASANCENFACVAGGVVNGSPDVSNFAEKYDPESKSWEQLPGMIRCRKLCSGCYMDKKFYVIGGVDEQGKDLTCGEFYDVEKNTWVLVPDMIKEAPSAFSRSPPLIAVANNQLYSLDPLTNQLQVYLKESNSWKVLGDAPVKVNMGWGVAFKSLGDELLVIGAAEHSPTGHARMMMFRCCPDAGANHLQWQYVETNGNYTSAFIFNCSVMVA